MISIVIKKHAMEPTSAVVPWNPTSKKERLEYSLAF